MLCVCGSAGGSRCGSGCRLARPSAHVVRACHSPAAARHLELASIDQSVAPSLQGGVHICKADEAPALAAKMLGGTLVTKQVSRSLGGGVCDTCRAG